MPIRYGFFDSVSGDRVYSADEFSRHIHFAAHDGIVVLFQNELKVVPDQPAGGAVLIDLGAAFIQGRWVEVFTEPVKIAVPTADPASSRIDRVILRLDYASRTIQALIKQGMPGPFPSPPPLARDENVHELSLARIVVGPGQTIFRETDIFDERFDSTLCGMAKPYSFQSGGLNAALRISRGADQIVLSNVLTPIEFDLVRFQTHTEMFNMASNTKITFPYPGKYLIQAHIIWRPNQNGLRQALIRKNGSLDLELEMREPFLFDFPGNMLSTTADMAAGDFAEVFVRQTSGASLGVLAGTDEISPEFMAIRLGD